MDGRDYEFTFELQPVSVDVQHRVSDELDAVFFGRGSELFVTVLMCRETALAAAICSIQTMKRLGVEPIRIVDDLVTRNEISERAGVTRQAVGNWIRGDRRTSVEFPSVFANTSVDLWLWRDVQDVLPALGVQLDEPLGPTREETLQISGALVGMHNPESLELLVADDWTPVGRASAVTVEVSEPSTYTATSPVEMHMTYVVRRTTERDGDLVTP